MSTKFKFILSALFVVAVVAAFLGYIQTHDIAVLNPKGEVAEKERNLLVFTTALAMVVIVPVYIMTFAIAWKYRASNKRAKYTPDWDGNSKLEFAWWAIPCAIILILSIITWNSSHELDPYKPLSSTKEPIKVQVIALNWKWLFIYPDYNIASVNYLQFPEDTPINFELTADAPMNSFWIPELGGQIYTMAGMNTKLHLMANEQGSYRGSSANLSGVGFAGMHFTAKATSHDEFNTWIQETKLSSQILGQREYDKLAKPSENHSVASFSPVQNDLYNTVIMKYMMPGAESLNAPATPDTPGDGSGHGH